MKLCLPKEILSKFSPDPIEKNQDADFSFFIDYNHRKSNTELLFWNGGAAKNL